MDNQKNLLLAVVFSLIILIGFDFFFGPKKNIVNENMPKDNEKLQRADADAPTIDEDTFVKKSEKLSVNEKRIKFKAERIRGSINLFGGTIDDITGIPKLTFDDKTADESVSAIADIKGVFDQVTGKETPSGEMFRLYNAAFARFPDASGLEYWIDKFSSGVDDE